MRYYFFVCLVFTAATANAQIANKTANPPQPVMVGNVSYEKAQKRTSYDDPEMPLWVKQNGKYGYADTTGKLVIPIQFDAAAAFFNLFVKDRRVAVVKKQGKYGMIDITGKVLVPFEYDEIGSFNSYGARIKKNGKYGIMSWPGLKLIMKPVFDVLPSPPVWRNGIMVAGVANKEGYIDTTGKWIIPAKYESAYDFNGDIARVKVGGLVGLINRKGEEVLKPSLQEIGDFYEDIAIVYKQNKATDQLELGYLNKAGKLIVPPKYTNAERFINGYGNVYQDKLQGLVDREGKVVIPVKYDYLFAWNENSPVIVFGKNDFGAENGYYYGMMDKSQQIILQPKYDRISMINVNRFEVKEDNVRFFVDSTGKKVN